MNIRKPSASLLIGEILDECRMVLSHNDWAQIDAENTFTSSETGRKFFLYACATWIRVRGLEAANLAVSQQELDAFEQLFLAEAAAALRRKP